MEEENKKNSIPWVRKKELGFLRAFGGTIQQVLYKPGEFFQSIDTSGPLWQPFSFYFFTTCAAVALAVPLELLLHTVSEAQISALRSIPVWAYFLIPVFIALSLFFATMLMHVFVLLFRGEGGVRGTFNILAYSAAINLLRIVPFVGPLISAVWYVVVGVIAYKRVHRLTTGRAACAYLSLPVLMIALFVTLIVPRLLKAGSANQEASARTTVMAIMVAIEAYRSATGKYPVTEYDLTYAKPPYLPQVYNNKIVGGYEYALHFRDDGYEVVARPALCGSTGNQIFKIKDGRGVIAEPCRR